MAVVSSSTRLVTAAVVFRLGLAHRGRPAFHICYTRATAAERSLLIGSAVCRVRLVGAAQSRMSVGSQILPIRTVIGEAEKSGRRVSTASRVRL